MRCRYPFTAPESLNSRSGPDVLVRAIAEALEADPLHRFVDLNKEPWREGDVTWYPVASEAMWRDIRDGKRIAIGPNVLFGDSQQPGAGGGEPELLAYQNFAAIFTLSRWYSALQQKHFAQKSHHFILDYPLPQAWIKQEWPHQASCTANAVIFVKGGAAERRIADALIGQFVPSMTLGYGSYTRADLFHSANVSRACFYVSREDHYPLAAVEIGLMGCPIISDEKICSVVQHGLTGIIAPVRERGESDGFRWTEDAADRMAVEWKAAAAMDRNAIREATIRKHSPALLRERVAAQLGLG